VAQGVVNRYNNLTEEHQKATLIPLPPLSYSMPTPELFREPLTISSGWINMQNTWLLVIQVSLLGWHQGWQVYCHLIHLLYVVILISWIQFKRFIPPVMISPQELSQVECYYDALLAQMEMANITSTLQYNQLPILELESIDEDAQDTDTTMKDSWLILVKYVGGSLRSLCKQRTESVGSAEAAGDLGA
jgi:hypothetical protein